MKSLFVDALIKSVMSHKLYVFDASTAVSVKMAMRESPKMVLAFPQKFVLYLQAHQKI